MIVRINNFDFEIVPSGNDYKVTVGSVAKVSNEWCVEDVYTLFKELDFNLSKTTKKGLKTDKVVSYQDAVELANILGGDYTPKVVFHAKYFAQDICSCKAIAIQVGCDVELGMMLCLLYKKALLEIEKPPQEYLKMVVTKLMTKIDAVTMFKEILRVTWRNSSDWYDNPHSVIKKALQAL